MLTASEFIKLSFMDKIEFRDLLAGQSFVKILTLRRHFQKALSFFAKKNKADMETQTAALQRIGLIERLAWRMYFYGREQEIIKNDWSKCLKGRASVKHKCKQEFENILKKTAH